MMKKLRHNFSSICQPQCRLPQTIQPYITRKQPISIDLPASKCVYALKLFAWYFSSSWIHIVSFVFGLVLCQSPIPSSLSFVTQSHLIRFHHKFPIILLHFISLEFVFFFLRSLTLYPSISSMFLSEMATKKLHHSFDRYFFAYSHKYLRRPPYDALLSNGCHYYYLTSIKIRPFAITRYTVPREMN